MNRNMSMIYFLYLERHKRFSIVYKYNLLMSVYKDMFDIEYNLIVYGKPDIYDIFGNSH